MGRHSMISRWTTNWRTNDHEPSLWKQLAKVKVAGTMSEWFRVVSCIVWPASQSSVEDIPCPS